eukprot:jgi/Psemu1/9391/gm1.9391_g
MNNRTNLSFQEIWEANNPPAPYTPGPMTQDAANSLLGIMKQPTPCSADPFRNSLQIDQDSGDGDDNAGANNNSSNNNNNNQTIELEAEPTTRSTRSKRPARVSLEPTPTNRIRNPYAKQYNNKNNNNKSSRRQTKKQKQKDDEEKEREREREREEAEQKQAAKPEEQEDKEVEDDEEIDANEAADKYYPAKNDPDDVVLHEMFTKKSKTLVDQAMKIWTTNIENLVSGDPLNFKSHHTYSCQLFSAFHSRGVPYNEAKDPTLGTKRTKAKFDEFVDEKFKKVINDGICKPYEDMLDLLKLMAMELGRQFGVRGKDELVFLQWKYLRMETFKYELMKDLRYVIVAPGGGFDKSHQLSLNNAEVSTNYPMVVEDTDNPNCIVKLTFYYRDTAKYVFKAKSPVGADTVRKWVRDFAEVADFKDWEKYTPHNNRHRCCTILASDVNVPEKIQMDHLRHKHAKSSHPYIHQNSKTQKTVQGVDNSKNSNNNKTSAARITNEGVIDVDQQDKEIIPELKKENKKQRTKLQDAEDNVTQLTIDLKESNNINKTLSNEADWLHQIGKQLQKEKSNLEQQLEKQKDLHEKELLHQQNEADTKLAELKD